MLKYIAGVLVFIGITLLSIYFFVGVPRIYHERFPEAQIPHAYGEPSLSLESIDVVGFYFIPNNRVEQQAKDWQNILEENLERVKVFHEAQFLGRSRLSWRVYEQPVIGLRDNALYDTPLPQHTNDEALRRIVGELPEVAKRKGHTYQVLVVMYEGIGATGSQNAALLSRTLFDEAFLAHEFYHALGVPDHYYTSDFVFEDGQTTDLGIVTSGDLMGRVQVPLERAYLDFATLQQMGL
jgi:hypothetical protein